MVHSKPSKDLNNKMFCSFGRRKNVHEYWKTLWIKFLEPEKLAHVSLRQTPSQTPIDRYLIVMPKANKEVNKLIRLIYGLRQLSNLPFWY